jgi:hypothetical protein
VKECDPAAARLQRDLADVGTAVDGLNQRAEEVLRALGRSLPFASGWLAVRDPERRRHVPLATTGEAEPLRRYFATPGADDELEHLGLNCAQRPVLASELPVPLPDICAWGEYLLPAGFRGGVAGPLFASTGRHVGFLSLLAEDPERPSPADRRLVAAVTRVIADDLDRTQEIATAARLVRTAEAGVVLTRGGDVLALPGLPGDRLLASGSPILAAATRELSAGGPYTAFLSRRRPRTANGWHGSPHWIAPSPSSTTCRPRCCSPPPGTCAASRPWTSGSWDTSWPARRRSPRSPRLSTSTRARRPRPSGGPRSPWTPTARPPLPRARCARGCASRRR